jgi:hypothetical protein
MTTHYIFINRDELRGKDASDFAMHVDEFPRSFITTDKLRGLMKIVNECSVENDKEIQLPTSYAIYKYKHPHDSGTITNNTIYLWIEQTMDQQYYSPDLCVDDFTFIDLIQNEEEKLELLEQHSHDGSLYKLRYRSAQPNYGFIVDDNRYCPEFRLIMWPLHVLGNSLS